MEDVCIEIMTCNRCEKDLSANKFRLLKNGTRLKNCIDCNEKYRTKNKGCTFNENCKCKPIFGLEGKEPTKCYKHKEEGMVNVINRMCQAQNCNKHAHFNFEGLRAIYCAEHKKPNMIDTVAWLCQEDGCFVRASFNYEGEKNVYTVTIIRNQI